MKHSDQESDKVDIVDEREWHVGAHAAALLKMEALGCVYGGFPAYRYLRLGITPRHLRTRSWPAVWNQLAPKIGLGRHPVDAPRAIANWVAGQPLLHRYVNCYSSVYRYLFPLLATRNHVLIIERGSTHPEEFFEKIERGARECGLRWEERTPPAVEIQQEIEAGHLSHFVAAGSRMIYDSYVSRGYDPERMLLIPYGVNHDSFGYVERPKRSGPVKIVCVGIIGVRKGLSRLLKISSWARKAGIPVQIDLVGPLQPEAPTLLAQARNDVRVHGVKKGEALIGILHHGDLYCLPSYEEGFGISVLEAMSTGLPAIVSADTGAREAIEHGRNGLILHEFTEAVFDRELKPLLENFAARMAMGKAARATIESRYTLRHYADRLATEYHRMFEIVRSAGGSPAPAWSGQPR